MSLLLIHTAHTSPLVACYLPDKPPLILSRGHDHAQHLPLLLDELFAQIDTKSISTLAVCIGTGSYTALRIGITAAKMLALSFSIPLIALQTSVIYAYHLHASIPSPPPTPSLPLAVIIETGRDTLRLETFSSSAPLTPSPPRMLTPSQIDDFLASDPHHIIKCPSLTPSEIGSSALSASLAILDGSHLDGSHLDGSHPALLTEPHAIDSLTPLYFGDTPS